MRMNGEEVHKPAPLTEEEKKKLHDAIRKAQQRIKDFEQETGIKCPIEVILPKE